MGSIASSLISMFWSQKMEIVIIGLSGSGKSTLVSQMSQGQAVEKGPTLGLDIENVKHGSVDIKCWDLGGQGKNQLELNFASIYANFNFGYQSSGNKHLDIEASFPPLFF